MPHAAILYCDIVGFSRQEPKTQQDWVRQLWQLYLRQSFIDPGELNHNGTGDGLLVVILDPNRENLTGLLGLSQSLIDEPKMWSPSAQMRVALHAGKVHHLEVGEEHSELIGNGVNEGVRIVPFAAPSQILVSRQFVELLYQEAPKGRFFGDLIEPPPNDPWTIYVKHGEAAQVHAWGARSKPSSKLQYAVIAADLLTEMLGLIASELCSQMKVAENSIDPRISLLEVRVDDADRRHLHPTNLRHRLSGRGLKPGRTRYGLDTREGPAIAFMNRMPSCVHGLPDPSVNLDAYFDAVLREWNVPVTTATLWSQRSRTFIAFPFGLVEWGDSDEADGAVEPDGVVCIDIQDPLEGVLREELNRIGSVLQGLCYPTLAALWRLRSG